jgi:hypothetical protein
MTYLEEELFKSIATQDVGIGSQTRLTKCLLEELGHLESHAEEFSCLFLLREDASQT